MSLPRLKLPIRKGETIAIPLRIESDTLTYKPITNISKSAPVTITAASHGLQNGWKAAVMNAGGMKQINCDGNPPDDAEMAPVTVVDSNTIQFNRINATGYSSYTSGGHLACYAPLDLSAYSTGRMSIKDSVGGTEILSLTTANSRIELDAATNTLWIRLTDEDSAAITATSGVFDIELETASGEVKAVCSADSEVEFLPEVTT